MIGRLVMAVWVAIFCLVQTTVAEAEDSWRTTMDRVNGVIAPIDYRMPVEACYVNQVLQPLDGYFIVTITNQTRAGLVIRKITSFANLGGTSVSSVRTHAAPFIYVMDARSNGEPIVRGALVRTPSTRQDSRVSVLRPGEACRMWLPQPEKDAWQVIVERVRVGSAGTLVDVLDRCMRTVGGRVVDCALRLDTVTYLPVETDPYGERVVRWPSRYDFSHNSHWFGSP